MKKGTVAVLILVVLSRKLSIQGVTAMDWGENLKRMAAAYHGTDGHLAVRYGLGVDDHAANMICVWNVELQILVSYMHLVATFLFLVLLFISCYLLTISVFVCRGEQRKSYRSAVTVGCHSTHSTLSWIW